MSDELYKNGYFMYSLFPSMLNKREVNILGYAFKLGTIKLEKAKNVISLKIADKMIQLNEDSYLPISQSLIGKQNNMSILDSRVVYYNIELNCVKDEEIKMDK